MANSWRSPDLYTFQATGQRSRPLGQAHHRLGRDLQTSATSQRSREPGPRKLGGKLFWCCHRKGASLIDPVLGQSALSILPRRRVSGHTQDQRVSGNAPCLKNPVTLQKPGRSSASGGGITVCFRGTGGAQDVCQLLPGPTRTALENAGFTWFFYLLSRGLSRPLPVSPLPSPGPPEAPAPMLGASPVVSRTFLLSGVRMGYEGLENPLFCLEEKELPQRP